MRRTRNPSPSEFRERIIALARPGRGVEELSGEFEPCAATIHGWIEQADRDGGCRGDVLSREELAELRRLCREPRQPCQMPSTWRWRNGVRST